jgi:PAS domain-containing protein
VTTCSSNLDSVSTSTIGNLIGLLPYLVTCSLIIAFGEAVRRAEQRANEQRELLRITLHSIGDAVITTDVEGRVTSMNAAAESLTGWMKSDGVGRPLDAVFRIVNEDTRHRSNPARRAGDGEAAGWRITRC